MAVFSGVVAVVAIVAIVVTLLQGRPLDVVLASFGPALLASALMALWLWATRRLMDRDES